MEAGRTESISKQTDVDRSMGVERKSGLRHARRIRRLAHNRLLNRKDRGGEATKMLIAQFWRVPTLLHLFQRPPCGIQPRHGETFKIRI